MECEAFGLDPSAFGHKPAAKGAIIWPCMLPAIDLFLRVGTQWRWTGAGMAGAFRTGLEYSALEGVARMSGVEMTPKLFDDIQTLEAAALAEWSKK